MDELRILQGLKDDYDDIIVKDPNNLYITTDENWVYLGSEALCKNPIPNLNDVLTQGNTTEIPIVYDFSVGNKVIIGGSSAFSLDVEPGPFVEVHGAGSIFQIDGSAGDIYKDGYHYINSEPNSNYTSEEIENVRGKLLLPLETIVTKINGIEPNGDIDAAGNGEVILKANDIESDNFGLGVDSVLSDLDTRVITLESNVTPIIIEEVYTTITDITSEEFYVLNL